MERSVRTGIAGAGFMGGVHSRVAKLAGARLVGVAGADRAESEAAAESFGAERAFDSAEEMIASEDIDVIHVCTPNFLHVPFAEAALKAGKHVICEKPLALDAAGAEGLVEQVGEARRQAGIPFVYRYYPTVREARERVREGKTGPLRLLHGTYLQDWLLGADDDNWRVDPEIGGRSRAFADIGSHWCDLIEFVSGHRITRLMARTLTAHKERPRSGAETFTVPGRDGGEHEAGEVRRVETEDAAVVQFETDQGALGTVMISQVSAGRKNRLWFEVDGAEEALAFDQENPETLWCGRRESITILRRDPAWMSPPAARFAKLPAGHPQGYADCFEAFVNDFYDAVESGDVPDGMPQFADGLRAAQLTEAVLASAERDVWVDIPEASRAGAEVGR